MAGKVHGKKSYFAIEDSAAAVLRNIGVHCDSITLDRDLDMADSTTIGQEAKTFVPGLDGAEIQLGGKFDSLAVTGPDPVLAGDFAAKVQVGFEYGPEGNAAAAVKYSGECYVSKYQVSTPLEGVVKFSATITITGAVTRGVFP
jgi:hypothetical protein